MTDTTDNRGMGDNAPDFALLETQRLERDYADLDPKVVELLEEARAQPSVIENDEQAVTAGAIIKRMGDLDKRMEETRIVENEPHLRRQNSVNGFFFALRERLKRRDKKAKAGAADVLQARINDYQDRKLAAEQAERERIAAEERRIAEAAQRQAAEDARKAEEARQAAERARKPETKEEKATVADTLHVAALQSETAAAQATDKAQDAYVNTLAKPADIVRTRGGSGVLLTSKREAYAEIVDDSKLDMAALWPFVSLEAKEKALRAWAKVHGHTKTMEGAAIGHRNVGVTR